MSPILELRRGDDLLGVLSYENTDQPVFSYRFEPTLRFSELDSETIEALKGRDSRLFRPFRAYVR
jgi:hypothetical protein